ncbi:divergent polysaccharide deacetylase family protein [Magnetospira sp. QH-2]|uniref:divergent polysaccharide deacetylase family protein n=1 Tax=Magnetospira sp. (strain QH-2) TaxID=1288970 RepID=UPI0003E81518|nr:divergent polysaccharide deacetylase family protein [Magnetospira sp. QH-2]CCQ73957.1 Conserved protein of unknown function [Magnetospira sp. QH-2]
MPLLPTKPLIRWVVYGMMAVGTLAFGYGAGVMLRGDDSRVVSIKKVSQEIPYYKRRNGGAPYQLPPPEPIFPDPIEELAHLESLPYEEALPHDIYEGPDPTPPESLLPKAPEPFLAAPAPVVQEPVVNETSAVAMLAQAPKPRIKPGGVMPPPKAAPVGQVFQELFPLDPPGAAASPQVASLPPAALPAPTKEGPMVAVVIDDLGIDHKRTRKTIALPGPLTMAFLTYAEDLASQTGAATAAGHELLVHFPMQPGNAKLDPGPEVLELGLEPNEIRRRLNWGLSRFEGFVGVNNHMGSAFTADASSMAVVLEELRDRGLFFLDSRTTGKTAGPDVARRVGIPFAMRNVFLDNVNKDDAVAKQLAILEKLARRNGRAIAIGHPRDATIRMLGEWLPKLKAKGITLVPLSRMVDILG